MPRKFVGDPEIEIEVLEIIRNAGKPASVEYVAYNAHLTWHTARAILFKLAAEGRVDAIDTTKSWIFQLKECEHAKP